ncbi:hypothetical protein NA57DRAFT_65827 [Rhizodiscina lignyota]|uniref:Uncharacterized protein n=1 Tax=Rhizodiscina lignyota TaxID=1504668 RepID=A0A9P4IIP2_9PEZI|nr:hypothetical protein NA57DRAFT_65827 [Rhizodiscina lignyota]
MPLSIKSINGDTCFLLTFTPPIAPRSSSPGLFPGSFTILVDPWLTGPTHIISPGFSTTKQSRQPCIKSLAELEDELDLILVSQDKPDHCNKATLKQLSPHTAATIVSTPVAAKKIRSWNHFDRRSISSLPSYDPTNSNSVYRISLHPPSPRGSPGEITITILAPKFDMSGLHNAIGITYRPPSTVLSQNHGSYINLPMTPPLTPMSPTFQSSTLSPSPYNNREKTLSVLYSPHGAPYPLVKSWAQNHLVKEGALPLTALIHSFDVVENPWYLGGIITTGFPGGCEIARNLQAKAWIGAHDAEKEVSGLGVKLLQTKKFGLDDIKRHLDENGIDVLDNKSRSRMDVVVLDVGEETQIPAM